MTVTKINRRRTLLVFLLLLSTATATTKVIGAKVSTLNNDVLSSSFRSAGRNLQTQGNEFEEIMKDDPGKDDSNTNANVNSYVPHPDGTAVVYQDQDGTWMVGKIGKYDSSTHTYTIQWDEDNMEEDFSDLNEVDRLILNAETNFIEDKQQDEEEGGFPINNAREQQEDIETGSSYEGDVPDDFNTGYIYKYEDLSEYVSWPIGTATLLEFSDGWYEGTITSFFLSDDKKNATYIVTWSDGNSDSFVNELEWMDLMVANAEDYEPWQMGTPAFGYPNPDAFDTTDGQESENAFLSGEITAFEGGAYTITWSNGDSVVYSDFDMIDVLVNNAGVNLDPSWMENYNPWPNGTPVTWDFDDGWWKGTVTDFSDGTYEVTWTDGSSKYYSNLEKVDQMVSFASGEGFIGNLANPETPYDDDNQYGDDMYGDYYQLETLVYAQFTDGWWAGYVDSYEDDYYVVRWSDDSVDKFLPGEDMDEMVMNGTQIPNDYGIYPVGTHVFQMFDDVWYWGTVEYSEGGFYQILWDDGTRTTYVSGSEIDEMVNNAYSDRMSPIVMFALAIFILGILGGMAYCIVKRSKMKREIADLNEQVRANELDLTEGNESEYSDQPTEGAKVV